jgi:hypothetical protein
VSIIKPAQKQHKTAHIHKTNTKQAKENNTTGEDIQSTGAKPLYSEEAQISLFKNVPVQCKISLIIIIIIIIIRRRRRRRRKIIRKVWKLYQENIR